MRPAWLWALAVVGPLAGGLAAGATESDAWVAVTALAWIGGPIVALLATWASLPRLYWVLRAVVGAVIGMTWTVVSILLWMFGVAAVEGADL